MDDVKYTKKVTAFNDDDIPYEVRMKHIIEAYRKDLKRLEALEKYAKGLEEENLLLQKKMEKTDAWLAEEPDRQVAIKKNASGDKATERYAHQIFSQESYPNA